MPLTVTEIIAIFEENQDPAGVAGMARYGIKSSNKVYGLRIPLLRGLAKKIGKDHALCRELWAQGSQEAHILAAMVADPKLATRAEVLAMVDDFDNWALTDQCASNFMAKLPFAWELVEELAAREEEFVRRTAYSLIASLTVADKKAPDAAFIAFLPLIERGAQDSRNYVKKAVNWALRQIGKRNLALREKSCALAQRLMASPNAHTRWVGGDAWRELNQQDRVSKMRAREK